VRARARRPAALAAAVRPHAVGLVVTLLVEPALGAPYLSTAHWLRDFAAWPGERREAWRRARFESVLAHAAAHVPRYRELLAGQAPADVALSELPIIGKRDVRSSMPEFLSTGWEHMPHVRKRTGGTSGEPLQYPLDLAAWTQMYAAVLHEWERTGYRYGERIVVLGAPPSLHPEAAGLKARLRGWLENRTVAATGVDVDRSSSLRRALIAGREAGAIWYGYAGTVHAMAQAVLDAGISVPGPRAIVTTSENLQPAWRAHIESAFGSPVYDQYGCNDGGVLAQTCAAGRFHIADSLSIVEVLDGDRPCPPGVEGDLVVTNLHARVLPFLRYRVDDRVVLGDGPCACGRPGRTLAAVAGRADDVIRLPGGRMVSQPVASHAFFDAERVVAYQFVQREPTRVKVRLEVRPGFGEPDWEAVQTALRRSLGDEIAIDHTTEEPLARTPAGKLRLLVGSEA
jgi:phenylacetate-CoA ligase